jgi:TRAP-type transport system small permease protein
MWLRKAANLMNKGLSGPVSGFNIIGAIFIVIVMLLTVADVIGRRLFNNPVTGTYELSALMLVITIAFGLAKVELKKNHVTIDLVVERFRLSLQKIIGSIFYVICFIFCCILTWRLYIYAMAVWKSGLSSGTVGVPVFYFCFVATLGFALFSLVILLNFLLFLSGVSKK